MNRGNRRTGQILKLLIFRFNGILLKYSVLKIKSRLNHKDTLGIVLLFLGNSNQNQIES